MNRWWQTARKRASSGNVSEGLSPVDLFPFELQNSHGFIFVKEHESMLHHFRKIVESQLEILQRSLAASTVVLLWVGPSKSQLVLYAHAGSSNYLKEGPFERSSGVLGALKDNIELTICPYRASSPAIPYYLSTTEVGSFYAQKILVYGTDCLEDVAILCIDRCPQCRWTKNEHALISLTVEQIKSALCIVRDQLFIDFDRRVLQQVFNGLQRLNAALDLESVYTAAVEALNYIVDADIVAVGSVDHDLLKLDFFSDQTIQTTKQNKFVLEDSIVGQVVKYRRTLPDSATFSAHGQVINGTTLFDQFKSLMVVPLFQEEGPVTGVMIIAAGEQNQFPRSCRELIEMIVVQVAIKLDLAKAHDQINTMAITDPLTGIANRRAFQRGFSAMYERALRRGSSFSLIVGDIDLFKRINDTFGHPFGDLVIKEVARQLTYIVRVGDLAARIGGEEFAILLEDTDNKGALEVAERLRQKVEKLELSCQQKKVRVTISLGMTSFPKDTDDQEKLFSYADQALYRAKERGRNQTVCWHETF